MHSLSSFGIYIHIPVCESLCGYCDFYSVKRSDIDADFWKKYFKKLVEEFQFKKRQIQNNWVFNSIYFGGGTPSLAPAAFIQDIIDYLVDHVSIAAGKVEITIEANPETVTKKLIGDIFSAGVNRVSMGVQSLNDRLLKILGRAGNREAILQAMEIISKGPINNWSADLIYGIPGQKERDIIDSIQTLVSYDVKHISAYALTMENGALHDPTSSIPGNVETGSQTKYTKRGKIISEARQHSHQKLIWDFMPANGFAQYEISNFARPGFSCLHNVAVWKYRPYMSLGTSGHSFFNGLRYRTIANIKKYLSEPVENSVISENASIVPDLFITTLRLKSRQGNALFRKLLTGRQFDLWQKKLNEFSRYNWVILDKSGFTITAEGLNYSNTMLESVYDELN